MTKSFAIPNNYPQQVNGKPGSLGGFQKRVSDFDNPLTSNTVDFTQIGSSAGLTSNS